VISTIRTIYVDGVAVTMTMLPCEEPHDDLTPVASVGREILGWLHGDAGLIVVAIASIAALASTGNAGVPTASRYPV
jgi:basic amino acid/polyamine antiporter, APA family